MDADPNIPSRRLASVADWVALKKSQPSDFDGHTVFDRMTPSDRLLWLEQAAEFVSLHKGAASKPGKEERAVAEDSAAYDGR